MATLLIPKIYVLHACVWSWSSSHPILNQLDIYVWYLIRGPRAPHFSECNIEQLGERAWRWINTTAIKLTPQYWSPLASCGGRALGFPAISLILVFRLSSAAMSSFLYGIFLPSRVISILCWFFLIWCVWERESVCVCEPNCKSFSLESFLL